MDKLPEEITVTIHKTPEGFWAKVKEFPHCYTQADNFIELIQMLNDAIFSYVGISEKDRNGFYVPKAFAEELRRREWGKFFEQLKNKQSMGEAMSEKYVIATSCGR